MTSLRNLNLVGLIAFSTACAGGSGTAPSVGATVTGKLATASYALTAPAVVAEDSHGKFFVAKVGDDGRFSLALPGDEDYRLSVAEAGGGGASVVTVSRIRVLGDDSHWVHFEPGAELELGEVHDADDDDGEDHDDGDDRDDDDFSAPRPACAPRSPESSGGEAELPYDVKLAVGQSFQLTDAFREKGPKPAAVLSVTMEGGHWRLAELSADTKFVVSAADCSHPGNRDVGRDRVFVTWQNPDGSLETDHLDLRYCEGETRAGDAGATRTSGEGDDDQRGSGSGHDDDRDDQSDEGHDGDDDDGDDGDDDDDDACAPGEKPVPVCGAPRVRESKCEGGGKRSGVSRVSSAPTSSEPACDGSTPTPPVSVPPVEPPAPLAPPSLG